MDDYGNAKGLVATSLPPTNSLLGVDVLRPRMKLWISGECDGTLVVSIDDGCYIGVSH